MKSTLVSGLMLLAALSLSGGITVLDSSGADITMAFRLEPYQLVEEQGFISISIPGMEYPSLSGAPLLPYLEAKIGLPPGSEISWSIQAVEEERVILNQRLIPTPTMKFRDDISRAEYLIDESLYTQAGQDYAIQLETQNFRGYLFAPLKITPFRYNGQKGLTVLKRALISVRILGNLQFRGVPETDELAELMLSQFVNPGQAKAWQSHTRNPVNYAPFGSADNWLRIETDREGLHKLSYQQLSDFPLTDIDPRDFRLFSTGGSLLPYQVVTPGPEFQELAIRVTGEEDGHFNSGDQIIFYGSNRDGVDKNQGLDTAPTFTNPYSQNSVYWLTFGGSFSDPPRRMETLPQYDSWTKDTHTQPAQARLETETHRRRQIGFTWYMSRLFGIATADYQFTLPLSEVVSSEDRLLSIRLQQEETDADIWHYINVFANDVEIAPPTGQTSFSWRGTGEYVFQRKSDNLVSGDNSIRIRVNRNGTDNLFLNFITVDYTQNLKLGTGQYIIDQHPNFGAQTVRYNVHGTASQAEIYRINGFADISRVPLNAEADSIWFAAPGSGNSRFVITTAAQYYSPVSISSVNPVDLTANPSQVDHIIIAPTEYLTQAQNLANMYADYQGITARVVDQHDILTQFNGGHPDPAAIRQFLRYVYHHFPTPRLKGVTLIGLGTFDWRNQSHQSTAKNKIMVYQRGDSTSPR